MKVGQGDPAWEVRSQRPAKEPEPASVPAIRSPTEDQATQPWHTSRMPLMKGLFRYSWTTSVPSRAALTTRHPWTLRCKHSKLVPPLYSSLASSFSLWSSLHSKTTVSSFIRPCTRARALFLGCLYLSPHSRTRSFSGMSLSVPALVRALFL